MKKNDWILLSATAAYSYLFYAQTAGFNFLLFSILLIVLLLLRNPLVWKAKQWQMAALGSLLTGTCVLLYGNGLSVFANVVSLSLLAAYSIEAGSSLFFSLLYAVSAYACSPVWLFIDYWERRQKATVEGGEPASRKTIWLLPIIVTLAFFGLYRASNPLFNDWTENWNLDFIETQWLFFTLGGLMLVYGFFYLRPWKDLIAWENRSGNELKPQPLETSNSWSLGLSIEEQFTSGKLLFILLNVLLLLVNLLDAKFLFLDRQLPAGLTYSQFLHQGITALIVSILVAIVIILYYFRGALHFHPKNKLLKALVYLWILQNVLMLCSAAARNGLYIGEYGLTYKRIGVYVFLLLTIVGLLTTYIKVWKAKTNYFLIRINSWVVYVVLVMACWLNWDLFITRYNMDQTKSVGREYLMDLSDANLSEMWSLPVGTTVSTVVIQDERVKRAFHEEMHFQAQQKLSNRLYQFMEREITKDWQSWNLDDERVKAVILTLNEQGKIDSLHFRYLNQSSLAPIHCLSNLRSLDLANCRIAAIQQVVPFKQLRHLVLSNNPLISIEGIQQLSRLQILHLGGTSLTDYRPLYALKNLKELELPNLITKAQLRALKAQLPQTMITIAPKH